MPVEEPNDLLVAYDDTNASRGAAEFAAKRAAQSGESVDIVHVGRDLTEHDIERAVGDAFDELGVPVNFHVEKVGGSEEENMDIRLKLSRVINDGGYEAVFVGNEEYGLFEKYANTSVSDALIKNHNAPVVIVPVDATD